MTRHTLSLVAIALGAAVVGAQGPEALSWEQRGKLYVKNRDVIEKIVTQTVASSRAPGEHLKRADSYYPVLFQFSQEIKAANDQGDKARVDELTGHLTLLLRDGLAPTLDRAKGQVEGGSGVEEFPRVKKDLEAQIGALLKVLQADSPARASLDNAQAKVNAIKLPEKK
jgi:hypothetical protein